MLTTVQASAYLHHIKLLSPDPEGLARFYGSAMQMQVETRSDGFLCTGPGRRLLIAEGPAQKLAHGAFACRDADALASVRARAETEGLRPTAFGNELLAEGAFQVVDPDGNVIVFGLGVAEPSRTGLKGPTQHLTLATRDVDAIKSFYADKLGFGLSDLVVNGEGKIMTCFMRSNHEHHSLACFYQERTGIDHHSYEAGDWTVIRDWCDHLGTLEIPLMWGPGRHGPGNNIFIFVVDPDGNWIEISAEMEVVHDRPVKIWPHAERTLNYWGRAILRAN